MTTVPHLASAMFDESTKPFRQTLGARSYQAPGSHHLSTAPRRLTPRIAQAPQISYHLTHIDKALLPSKEAPCHIAAMTHVLPLPILLHHRLPNESITKSNALASGPPLPCPC